MIRYIPLLKAKRGELNAMSELDPKVKEAICPLFDFPRRREDYDSGAYPFKRFHYFIRGGSMRSRGAEQYFALAKELCGNTFFRGPKYSSGDAYLHEKSRSEGKNATNGAVVKPSVVAHVTYMVLGPNA